MSLLLWDEDIIGISKLANLKAGCNMDFRTEDASRRIYIDSFRVSIQADLEPQ